MSIHRIISTQKQTASAINIETGEVLKCFLSKKYKPICGDFVEVQHNKNENVISAVEDRKNVFSRATNKGIRQPIAANVDIQVIVAATYPEPNRDLINRYLVAAHVCNIEPIIVFNKLDLDPSFFDEEIKLYKKLGYEIFLTSTKQSFGLEELKNKLIGKTSIFVGMSGVGKSSLSELILGQELKTGEVSAKTGKGSHVTSVTHLYSLPKTKGFLIDSPGVWEYGLWKMEPDQLAHGFLEFDDAIQLCKFSNCTHIHEPKCGVKAAVEAGEVLERRYQSYLRIVDSMKYWD